MPEPIDSSLLGTIAVAYRHFNDATTTEAEREQILRTLVDHGRSAEAEAASRAIHHRQAARDQQLTIAGLLAQMDPPSAKNGTT
ncbi:MAG: hypothetical protein V4773_27715 [Verrucomicrobiota bacterium]